MESSSFVFMKGKWFFVLCLLTVEFVVVASDAINESHVAQYFIKRRRNYGDLFSVVFKQGFNPSSDVSDWCKNLNASDTRSGDRSCSCLFDYNTFLPDLGKCVNKDTAGRQLNAGIVSGRLTNWEQLFFKTLNLGDDGIRSVPNPYSNCQVITGSPGYYRFGLKMWDNINQQIFNFKHNNGERFEWKRDKTGELSGRIIRLKVNCSVTPPRHSQSGYLFFKASGNVTYCRLGSKFSHASVCPTLSSSSLSSSLLPSSLSSSLSFSKSSLPFLVPTRTRQQASSLNFEPPQSQSSLSTVYVASSRHLPSVTRGEINFSTAVNQQKASTQVFSRSIFPPVVPPQKPSKSLAVSTSATLPPSGRDPGGGAGARTGDGNNGAVIGAAVGGAVALVALTIILLVILYKRRNQKRSKGGKTPPEVKNPVYGRNDNDIHMTTQTQRKAIASKGKDNQSVYQSLTHRDKGSEADGELYVNPDSDYDNHPVYQSLERKTTETGTPVYQSLQTGTTDPEYTYAQTQPSRANILSRPKLDAADKQRKRSSGISGPVTKTLEVPYTGGPDGLEEPLYNVLEGSDSVKGSEGEITVGKPVDIQEPLYNELKSEPPNGSVRKGLDAEQNYDASEDQVYEPTGAREPFYNVLEGEAPESPHDSLDPLYSVLDEPDHGTYERAMGETGQASARRPVPQGGLQNPTYERTEDFEISKSPQYASVERSGPRKESLYQPLKRI